jgi:GTP cyclohydrolase I
MDRAKIEQGVKLILEGIGEDPERPGLTHTPRRVAEICEEIFKGIGKDAREYIQPFLPDVHDEMVILKDIPFYSICEHHLLPFFGKAHIAYLPKEGRVVGLSKLARVVDIMTRKLQLQERLTTEIAKVLMDGLNPHGVLVVIEAEHLCITMRGVKKPHSLTITSAVRGIFEKNEATRAEAFSIIKGR